MYLAGYANGIIRHDNGYYSILKLSNSFRMNPENWSKYEIELGIVDYAQGFDDGIEARPQKIHGPLEYPYG